MESKTGRKKPSRPLSMLGPGFRFHPTDEELVQFYLRRKVSGKAFRFEAITDVDVYKIEPWDLPYVSKLKTRDLEWYFFSFLDKKYGNGARTNRATEKGYWKTTGKDRAVYHKKQIVGMKKTLVYHCGRAPKGQRSNWVMHEYRLVGSDMETAGVAQDAFVVCRIFQKSGSGPKNGEQYGAPFVEEDWDNDELESVPQDDATEEVDFGDNACLDSNDLHHLQQMLGSDVPLNTAPPVSFDSTDNSHFGKAMSFGSTQDHLVPADACNCEPKICYDQNIQNSLASYDVNDTTIKKECFGERNKSGDSDEFNFLLNDPFFDSFNELPTGDEGFIEANDLSNPFETTTNALDMLEEYLDASDDSSFYLASDPEMIFGTDDLVSNQTLLPQADMGNGTEQSVLPMGQLINNNNNFDAAISPENPGLAEYQSGFEYPYIRKASQMLGNIQAPPAFAAEFPSKDAILRLSSITGSPPRSSSSTVEIRKWKMGKRGGGRENEKLNVVVSFGFSHGDDGSSSLESSVRIVRGTWKTAAATSSMGWLCFISLWILVLSLTFRFGTYIRLN